MTCRTRTSITLTPRTGPHYQAMLPVPELRLRPGGKRSGANLPWLITPMDWPGAAAAELPAPEDTGISTAVIHAPMSVPPDGLAHST